MRREPWSSTRYNMTGKLDKDIRYDTTGQHNTWQYSTSQHNTRHSTTLWIHHDRSTRHMQPHDTQDTPRQVSTTHATPRHSGYTTTGQHDTCNPTTLRIHHDRSARQTHSLQDDYSVTSRFIIVITLTDLFLYYTGFLFNCKYIELLKGRYCVVCSWVPFNISTHEIAYNESKSGLCISTLLVKKKYI